MDFWCWLGFHKWTKWDDVFRREGTNLHYFIDYQEHICEKCGIKKLRKIDTLQ